MKFLKKAFIIIIRTIVFLFFILNASNLFSQTLLPKYISTTPLSNGYYEYLPQGYDPTSNKTYPLLLCFGGYGENGDGSPAQLPYVISVYGATGWQIKQNIFPTSFTVNGQSYKFVILFPQFTGVASPQNLNDVIDYSILHYRVDVTRIYMTGFSLGGGLIWNYTGYSIPFANRVAAIVPICGGSYGEKMKAETIAAGNIAVWATHNDGDPVVPVDTTTIAYINLINAASSPPNPLARMTIFHDNSHNAWDSTYLLNKSLFDNLTVYEWMLQFKRGPGTLSVTGLDFSAIKIQNDAVLLNWKTYLENNNRGFTIERSKNGITFDSIGFISSLSVAGAGAAYTFKDISPGNGKNYYRLKQINFDTKINYSLVKIIEIKNIIALKIFPNPVKNILNIKVNFPLTNGQLKIINAKGQLVGKFIINRTSSASIPVKHLPPGVYTGEIINDNRLFKFSFAKQ
ncbi:MAG TPA: T9SS type A sorting domain-containing protein [Chitinophagaceae bacterium]|nr:T9SS type A sorting domain-containing protein [Chitinophagaceae bacterium]